MFQTRLSSTGSISFAWGESCRHAVLEGGKPSCAWRVSGLCQRAAPRQDFSVPGFTCSSETPLGCADFFFPRFSPPSAFVLPVNNFPDTCERLVLLQSPLHPRAVLSPFSFFWHRFRPATVVSAALCLLGSLPLFLDVCRCRFFPSLFFCS